jgi:hypothetical protein
MRPKSGSRPAQDMDWVVVRRSRVVDGCRANESTAVRAVNVQWPWLEIDARLRLFSNGPRFASSICLGHASTIHIQVY